MSSRSSAVEDIQHAAERIKAEGKSKPRKGRHPVNQPMVDHWLDAIGDKNPIYTDEAAAKAAGHPGVVAPPAMIQVWTMAGLGGVRADDDPLGKILGLFDDAGMLQSVGVCATFTMQRRAELVEQLAPLALEDGDEHPWSAWQDAAAHEKSRLPGAVSRWSAGKTLDWHPLRPDLVVEVGYDAMEGSRFRHTTQFKRWRPDRDPASCTYEQLERPVRYDLAEVLRVGSSPDRE